MLTIKYQLYKPTKNKELKFLEIIKEFTACCRWYLEILQREKTTSRVKIHRKYYQKAKSKFNLLSANIQQALDKAIETQRAYYKKQGKRSKPQFRKEFACFRQDTFKIFEKYIQLNFSNRQRVNVPFKICNPNHEEYLNQKPKRAQLIKRKNKWFLHVSYQTPKIRNNNPNIIGIDLGVKRLAVVSNPEGTINKFFSGNKAIYVRNKYNWSRQQIQRAKDIGEAKRGFRALKRISGKERKWITDINHKISKQIVEIAKENKANIAIENLKGIRERIKATRRVRRMLHNWAFRQLISFLTYKSAMAGVGLVALDPRGTSITCSRCGHSHKRNRKNQSEFVCKKCGFHLNADLNASRNVALIASDLYGGGKCLREQAVTLPVREDETLNASCL